MSNKIQALLPVLIFMVLFSTGCDNPDDMGFPKLFGPMEKFDPVNQTGVDSSTDIIIYAIGNDNNSQMADVSISIDNNNWEAVAEQNDSGSGDVYAYFYNVTTGRHLVTATHAEYESKNKLINVIFRDNTYGEYPSFEIYLDRADADEWEINNNYDTATDLGSSPFNDTKYARISTSSDEDYYMFFANISDNIYVSLYDVPENCNYDIQLYQNDSGSYTHRAGSYIAGNGDEYFSYPCTAGNDLYYIRVYSPDKDFDVSNNYRLEIEVSQP